MGSRRYWANALRRLTATVVPIGMAAATGFGCTSPNRMSNAAPAIASATRCAAEPTSFACDRVDPSSIELPLVNSAIPAAALGSPTGEVQFAQYSDRPDILPSPDFNLPADTIDLGIALQLAGVDNPTINLARERIQEANADRLAAETLLLPTVNIGGNYHEHQGALEASFGLIRQVDSQSLYGGLGARTLAAESVAIPGVRLFAHLGDAYYEPLAAGQRVAARRSDALAVRNAILLDVATAYLELIGAEARLAVLRQGRTELGTVVRVTQVYAEKGQGRQSDANRVATRSALLDRDLLFAQQDIAIASARLGSLLSLDPTVRLRTPGGPVELIRLVPEDAPIEALLADAARARPELFARSAELQEAQVRVRQEQVRPWVPILSVGYSAGAFGGGSNLVTPDFSPFSARSDFDVVAVWNFENLGFGNRARTRRADAVVGQTIAELNEMTNRVRREVAEALADVRAAGRQMESARQALGIAEEGFRDESERIRQGEGRPIELLDSFRQLLDARQEILRATVAFDIAQFRLFVAVGSNPLAAIAGECPTPNPRP